MKSTLALEAIFALVVDRLSASGLIEYLSRSDDIPFLSPEILFQTMNASLHTFRESRDPAAMHAGLLPGLVLSGLAQILAMGTNLFMAILKSQDKKTVEQDQSVPKD